MKTEFTCDYFLAKFSAIPESAWCTGMLYDNMGGHCAYGHCRVRHVEEPTVEAEALARLFGMRERLFEINDDYDPRYQQPTPKQRILAALQDIKAKQDMDKSIEVAKKAVDDFMDFAKEVKALKEPKREIVYVKLEGGNHRSQPELMEKALAVIASCVTLEQLKGASRYMNFFLRTSPLHEIPLTIALGKQALKLGVFDKEWP